MSKAVPSMGVRQNGGSKVPPSKQKLLASLWLPLTLENGDGQREAPDCIARCCIGFGQNTTHSYLGLSVPRVSMTRKKKKRGVISKNKGVMYLLQGSFFEPLPNWTNLLPLPETQQNTPKHCNIERAPEQLSDAHLVCGETSLWVRWGFNPHCFNLKVLKSKDLRKCAHKVHKAQMRPIQGTWRFHPSLPSRAMGCRKGGKGICKGWAEQ